MEKGGARLPRMIQSGDRRPQAENPRRAARRQRAGAAQYRRADAAPLAHGSRSYDCTISARPVLALACAAALLGCDPPAPTTGQKPTPEPTGPPWFADVTDEVGIDFVHDAGAPDIKFMPQVIGSGAALVDFNNDGLLDVYLLQNGGPEGARNRLYRQTPDHHFKDVSAGLDVAGRNMGVAVGDVNNDGWPDVLVTQYGGVRLLLNSDDGTFTDVTEEAGLKNPE